MAVTISCQYDEVHEYVVIRQLDILRCMVVRALQQQSQRGQRYSGSARHGAPWRKTLSVNSTTSRRTPPPGASRSTFGTKPLYSAAGPSSRKIVTSLRARREQGGGADGETRRR